MASTASLRSCVTAISHLMKGRPPTAALVLTTEDSYELLGHLTHETVGEIYSHSLQLNWHNSGPIVIDLAKVETVDSAGLAMLLEWHSRSSQNQAELEFTNAPQHLLKLAALSNADRIMNLHART